MILQEEEEIERIINRALEAVLTNTKDNLSRSSGRDTGAAGYDLFQPDVGLYIYELMPGP